jgi:hypothetical protein
VVDGLTGVVAPLATRTADQKPDTVWPSADGLARPTQARGVHDAMSWKDGYPIPRRTNYPLLFSRYRTPKPAFGAVLNVPAEMK